MPIRVSRLAVVLATMCLLPLVGCIGVQSNVAREFRPFPPQGLASSAPPNVLLTVTFTASGMPATEKLRSFQDAKLKDMGERLLNETGAVRAAMNPSDAQYRLALKVNDQGGGQAAEIARIVTYVTFTVLPSWVTQEYTTVAELTGPTGKVVATRRDVHSLTTITELFLVLGMPFAGVADTHQAMWTAVLQDLSVWTAEQVQRNAGQPAAR
jgi:hypothetical protein